MKKITRFITIVCFLTLSCARGYMSEVNPSGVWQFQGLGNMTYEYKFSWGKNPTNNFATIIDLDDAPPYIDTDSGRFFVKSVLKKAENTYQFQGTWGKDEIGSIVIFYQDNDTMWFVDSVPKGKVLIGPKNYYKRVPIDAPVVPIDLEKGP